MQIIDDIVDIQTQENIKNTLLDNNFSWNYVDDVSIKNNEYQRRPGFSHHFVKNNNIVSEHYDLIKTIILNAVGETNLINARTFLQLPLNAKFIGKGIDTPHLDLTVPHTVILYYVNDSDGDTVLYDYISKDENDIPYFEDVKIKKTITPKQGRVVIFNGLTWHTARQPKENVRCIINCNIVGS